MKILVAIPAFNEGRNIERTIKDLIDNNIGYDFVVVDNGSFDDTVQVCKQLGVDVVSHCVNSGSSAGTVMTYLVYAYKHDYDILCQFDGDGQHIASELPKIIQPVKNGEADYVMGSRFLNGEGFQSTFMRRIGIRLFSYLDSKLTGLKITDVTSGFRAYSKKTIEFFVKYYRHELYDPSQLVLLSHYSGAKIKEVPVRMKERTDGRSEFQFFSSISFTLKGIINIVGCVLQKDQINKYRKGMNINGN